MRDLTLVQAQSVLKAAIARAKRLKVAMNIAVVDAGAHLLAFARMDGALIGSIDIALKKAKTARLFDMETGAIGGLSQPGQSLYGIEVSNGGLITFPGGVPIRDESGRVIGAIGVSGSNVENDQDVAATAAQAVR